MTSSSRRARRGGPTTASCWRCSKRVGGCKVPGAKVQGARVPEWKVQVHSAQRQSAASAALSPLQTATQVGAPCHTHLGTRTVAQRHLGTYAPCPCTGHVWHSGTSAPCTWPQ